MVACCPFWAVGNFFNFYHIEHIEHIVFLTCILYYVLYVYCVVIKITVKCLNLLCGNKIYCAIRCCISLALA